MKKIISILLCLALVLSFALVASAEETSTTLVTKDLGLSNGTDFTSTTIGQCDFSASKGTGSNGPKYYDTGTGLRFYNGNILTFTPKSGYSVSKIEFLASGSSYNITFSAKENVSSASTDNTTVTVIPADGKSAIVLTTNNTSRIQKIIVTYDVASTTVVEVTGVTIDPSTVNTSVGETFTLSASVSPADASNKAVTLSTDNTDIISLDTTTGAVLALKEGTATVTATSSNNITATCVITVSAADSSATKVTDTSVLCAGNKVVLVEEVNKLAMGPKQSNKDRYLTAPAVISNGSLAVSSTITVITLEAGTTTGSFLLKIDGGYLYFTGDSNYVNVGEYNADKATAYEWTVNENGFFSNVGTEGRYLLCNPSSGYFSAYSGTSEYVLAVSIYGLNTNVYANPDPDPSETPSETPADEPTFGIIDAPVAGTAYKFGMIQKNDGNKVYYLAGGMNEYYMATTTDVDQAIDVYLEATEDGYHLYTVIDGTKTYINMVVNGTYVNGAYEAAASTVYTIKYGTVVATVNGEEYWFATRNDMSYTTMGPCKVSYEGFQGEFYGMSSPKTADSFSAVVIALMAVSVIGAGYVISKKKEF